MTARATTSPVTIVKTDDDERASASTHAPSSFRRREIAGEIPREPLLSADDDARFVIYPIKHGDIWDMYKKHQAQYWTAEELDLSHDRKDWDEKLTDNERYFLTRVLAFFAASDGIVNENLLTNFAAEVTAPEARAFYGFQAMIENIHGEVYSLLIDVLITDTYERAEALNAMKRMACVRDKAQWALAWCHADNASFAERLVAFAAVEGVFFSGSFCAIFWLKKRGLMCQGLGVANEFIARDEGMHCDFACLLYGKLETPLPVDRVREIIGGAVAIEKAFVCDALPVELIGMNASLMCEYIDFCAVRLLRQLGDAAQSTVANPFPWMDMISMEGKSNFFEKRVAEYAKAGFTGSTKQHHVRTLQFDADF